MLDRDPEALFENKELIFGPAADRIVDAVGIGEGHGTHAESAPGDHPSSRD
jgi:hypothetical protein